MGPAIATVCFALADPSQRSGHPQMDADTSAAVPHQGQLFAQTLDAGDPIPRQQAHRRPRPAHHLGAANPPPALSDPAGAALRCTEHVRLPATPAWKHSSRVGGYTCRSRPEAETILARCSPVGMMAVTVMHPSTHADQQTCRHPDTVHRARLFPGLRTGGTLRSARTSVLFEISTVEPSCLRRNLRHTRTGPSRTG